MSAGIRRGRTHLRVESPTASSIAIICRRHRRNYTLVEYTLWSLSHQIG
jgi:hypothetical protein